MEMRDLMESLQQNHHISRAELARVLGYKSVTSLARLHQGEYSYAGLQRFAAALRSTQAFPLTTEEERMLSDLLLSKRVGQDKFRFYMGVEDMLHSSAPLNAAFDLRVGDQRLSLRQYFAEKSEVTVDLYGQISPALASALSQLLQEREGPDFRVFHFTSTVQTPLAVLQHLQRYHPLLCCPWYQPVSCKIQPEDETTNGLLLANCMLVRYRDVQADMHTDSILFYEPGLGTVIPLGDCDLSLLRPPKEREEHQLSRAYAPDPKDLIAYSLFCWELEKNREIYQFKGAMGIEQVPPAILEHALLDSLPALPDDLRQSVTAVLPQLIQIYQLRYQETCTKRKPQWHIFRLSAIRAFLETGRRDDHFWMIRAYTPEERWMILRETLLRAQNNPAFHVLLLRDDSSWCENEITLYGLDNLSVLRSHTDYAGEHLEVQLTQPKSFLKAYRDCYLHDLIPEHCLSEKESLQILSDL